MKPGWVIIILSIVLLIAAFFFGRLSKTCADSKPEISYSKDKILIDSLRQQGINKDTAISVLRQIIIEFKKQKNETPKLKIIIHVDSIHNDSIPPVFSRLSERLNR
jgi:hypothetical protein